MTYKAILIDLDGTLVDSTGALYQAYLKFLEYFGKKGSREEFESLIGPSIDQIVALLSKKHELPKSEQNLSSLYFTMIVAQGFNGVELFPGALEFIKEAKENKIKLAIITSGTRDLVNRCLGPLKVTEDFDLIVTSEDVPKAKPHPEIYQLALKKLELSSEEAIAVEDSEGGVHAALGAGLKVIYITHGIKVAKVEVAEQQLVDKVFYLPNWKEIQLWLQSEQPN